MSDLRKCCRTAQDDKRKLLSIYLTCGYPEPSWTVPLAESIFRGGADFIELGIPFSDPIADGPVIQAASTRSLNAGTTLNSCFESAAQIASAGRVLFMGYFNSLLAVGIKDFLARSISARVQGLIIPDLLYGQEQDVWNDCANSGIPLIPFVAPTTTNERCAIINQAAAPFVYAVSIAGVTGVRSELPQNISHYLNRVRAVIKTPLLVGFGISNAQSARALSPFCDGIIVGSALIQHISAASSLTAACQQVEKIVAELRAALDE